MSRERMTKRRSPQAKSLLAEIDELKKRIIAMDDVDYTPDAQDAELEADADAIAEEEVAIAEESTDVTVDIGVDQNDKAMDNWPVADREAVASSLLKLANALLED